MANSPLKISIKNPCNENWDKMAPVGFNQRHCANCEKNVVDFTHMTDREVHRFIRQNNGKICGRWRPNQLDRPIIEHPRKAGWWQIAASTGALLLASTGLQAQRSSMAPCSMAATSAYAQTIETEKKTEQGNNQVPSIKVFGNVFDQEGNLLIGATVVLGDGKTGTLTDLDGYYEIEVPKRGAKLTVSFIGYGTQEAVVETPLPGERSLGMNFVLDAGIELQTVEVKADQTYFGDGFLMGDVIVEHHIVIEEISLTPIPPQPNFLQSAIVFPNPFVDHLAIELNPEQPTTIIVSLFDTNGSLLKEWPLQELHGGRQQVQFPLKNMYILSGHYFLQLIDGDGRMETRVVIK